MLDELASHFSRIQDHLQVSCDVISSSHMQNDPSINDGNVACENGLHFDKNDASNVCFNEKTSISDDNAFGMKFEPQEASINYVYITPLEECVTNEGSKIIITQEDYMNISLVSTQVTNIQDNIYESLELSKTLPSLLSFDYVIFAIKPPFNNPSRPLMVDYSLTKSP